mmetsp:Transcript_25747/g.50380  ORF Transcript_25747/g.50380 Transcript_25747/m.50380 type:complete len:149 (-) Transcript_25747:87-533(-)
MLKVAKEFQIEDIEIATYLALYEEARFGGGRKIQNVHALSPYLSKNKNDINTRRRSSIIYRETMDIIDADQFSIFLRTLINIMEKIRVGYRAQAKSGQTSRVGSQAKAPMHRRASSDQLSRISGRSNRELNVPHALISRQKFVDTRHQ